MLVLSREKDETIMVGDDIEVMVTTILDNRVKIGIRAPRNLPIHRKEIWDKIQKEGVDRKNPYEVVINHTDPTEKETALCLKYRQRARDAQKALAVEQECNDVIFNALKEVRSGEGWQECNDGNQRLSPLTYGQLRQIAFKALESYKAIRDKQLEAILMADKK